MSKALKELVANTAPAPSQVESKPSIEQTCQEYADLDVQFKALAAQISRVKKRLKAEMAKLTDPAVPVVHQDEKGNQVDRLLCLEIRQSKSFDLEAAEETLSKKELSKLEPFIKTERSLQLKAAEELIDMSKFQKFIETTETESLNFRKLKEDEEE